MKKIRNIFIICLCFVLFFATESYAYAQDSDLLEVNFDDFQFSTNDYNGRDTTIEYIRDEYGEIAKIIDDDGNVIETLRVQKLPEIIYSNNSILNNLLRVQNIYPHVFTRSVQYGKTSVEFNMNVELYNRGSFRAINDYKGGYVGIGTSITNTRLEGSNHNAWSPNGFPTGELYYAFNGTIIAEITSSTSSSVKADLIGAGFSIGWSESGKTFYRRSFNSTGIVKLYNY